MKSELTEMMEELQEMYGEAALAEEAAVGTFVYILLDQLHPHPDNPRRELGDLTELAESIKAKGIMQNLTVVPREAGGYTVIIGHRRSAAARLAGLEAAPCVITKMSEREQVATMLLENMQRADLTAYEQAKGFQMMMDLGESVRDIVDKTGFSESTVRRRLKMAELDENILKKVSARQISFDDMDKLSKIEDIGTRNKVLADIGTANFNNALKSAIDHQNMVKVQVKMREVFKTAGLIEETKYDTSKYCYLCSVVGTNDLEEKVKEAVERGAVAYYFSWNTTFYVMRKKEDAGQMKKSEAELESERAEQERKLRYEKLAELSKRAFELRRDFIDQYSLKEAVIHLHKIVAFMVSMAQNYDLYDGFDQKQIEDLFFGYETGASTLEEMCDAIEPTAAAKGVLAAVWLLTDSDDENYFDYCGEYDENDRLNMVYEFLESLGYEMSDDEKALMDGTHELFRKEEQA